MFAAFVVAGIAISVFEPTTKKAQRDIEKLAKQLSVAESDTELESALKLLADLRAEVTDSALVAYADSIIATSEVHRGRVALLKKKAAAAYAFEIAKETVLKQLKAPKTASFSGYEESKFWYDQKQDVYYVQLFVDAQNSFGAYIREHYQLKLEQSIPGTWTVKEILQIERY